MSPLSPVKRIAHQVKTERALKSPPSSISDVSIQDSESVRGRRQDRDSTDDGKAEDISGDDVEDTGSKPSNGQHRKRKRSRKGLDKKYHCPQGGCGKSYSRAEHLYRHQLNRELSCPSFRNLDADVGLQIRRSKFTNAIFPIVPDNSSDKISALGTENGIQLVERIYSGKILICIAGTPCKLSNTRNKTMSY